MSLKCTIRDLPSWPGINIRFRGDILGLLAVSVLLVAHDGGGDCFVLSCLQNFVRLRFLSESTLLTSKLFSYLRYTIRLKNYVVSHETRKM
jgi:hypothetical protein